MVLLLAALIVLLALLSSHNTAFASFSPIGGASLDTALNSVRLGEFRAAMRDGDPTCTAAVAGTAGRLSRRRLR